MGIQTSTQALLCMFSAHGLVGRRGVVVGGAYTTVSVFSHTPHRKMLCNPVTDGLAGSKQNAGVLLFFRRYPSFAVSHYLLCIRVCFMTLNY